MFFEIFSAKVQNSKFFKLQSSSSVKFRIIGYYNPGQLWHAGSQTLLPILHVPMPIFVALRDDNPPTLQTDG